jgi:hypothetical protein
MIMRGLRTRKPPQIEEAFSGNESLCGRRVHAHPLLGLSEALEFHHTIDQCEERIVTPNPDVVSRVDLRPALPNEDAARGDKLSTKALHAQTLGVAVTTIA